MNFYIFENLNSLLFCCNALPKYHLSSHCLQENLATLIIMDIISSELLVKVSNFHTKFGPVWWSSRVPSCFYCNSLWYFKFGKKQFD